MASSNCCISGSGPQLGFVVDRHVEFQKKTNNSDSCIFYVRHEGVLQKTHELLENTKFKIETWLLVWDLFYRKPWMDGFH